MHIREMLYPGNVGMIAKLTVLTWKTHMNAK